jgi:hypothetical protein
VKYATRTNREGRSSLPASVAEGCGIRDKMNRGESL